MLLTLSFLRSVKRGIIRGVLPSQNAGVVLTSHPYHFVSVIRARDSPPHHCPDNCSADYRTLSFQAILFYIPRWLWKNWEAGKVSALRMDLNLGIISDVEKKLKKKLLIDYLYSNLKHHNFWAYRYFFCEFLALLNVSGWSITEPIQ